MKVVITEEAEADLERIADHIALSNPSRAATFVEELVAHCLDLGEMPFRFSRVPRYETSGVRRRPHGKYLIFYWVLADRVEVLHVLHGAQDYESILFRES